VLRNPDAPFLLAGFLGVGLLLVFLGMRVLRHRRAMAQLRYKALESLAKYGHLSGAQTDRALEHRRSPLRLVILLAWLGLVAGCLTIIVGAMRGGYEAEQQVDVGMIVALVSTALLAIPMFFHELRRKGVK